jgi:hypothetical protein
MWRPSCFPRSFLLGIELSRLLNSRDEKNFRETVSKLLGDRRTFAEGDGYGLGR